MIVSEKHLLSFFSSESIDSDIARVKKAADGEEIEPDPEAKITVSVNLPEIEDGQEVEVRHITDNGSELLESTNEAGTITFTTNSFSLFEFTSTAQKLSSWTSGLPDAIIQAQSPSTMDWASAAVRGALYLVPRPLTLLFFSR